MISAAICTRNRGASVAATISTILAIDDIDFELVIVDQSTNEETAQAVAPFESDPRVRFIRTGTKGLGVARNIALGEVKSDLVAYTDDDCTAPTDWLRKVYEAFQIDRKIAVVYTTVEAAPHDSSVGLIPAYRAKGERVFSGVLDKRSARGIGAGMAVRASMVRAMGGFDEMLGAGGQFPSCEDWDIAVRALIRGYSVLETDKVSVVHFGFRSHDESRFLSKRDWTGIGAAYSKPIRCGHVSFAGVIINLLSSYALTPFFRDLRQLKRPRGIMRIVHFSRGFLQGMRTPINKSTLCFIPAQAAPAAPVTVKQTVSS